MDILFINHTKSQCGVYEIGKRIFNLLDQNILPIIYYETPLNGINEYYKIMQEHKPKYVFYNYFSVTLPYLTKNLFNQFPNTKHIGIIHDPFTPEMINFYNTTFDYWLIHDDTNDIKSNNKFTTVRPIKRFTRKNNQENILNIGSHGFNVSPWKMFDKMIEIAHSEFDEVNINLNISDATFGDNNNNVRSFNEWKKIITKKGVNLNITNNYYEDESDLIEFLSKNHLNMYFYNPPHPYVGVGGSADLAVSSQSSLVVNNSYMYRHFHEHLGFYEKHFNLKSFLENKDKVKKLYEEWSPERITTDYKKILESI
jgi:hypothetical protein